MRNNIIQIIMIIMLLLLFLLFLYLVITKKIDERDQKHYEKISKMINSKNTKIIKRITFLGSTIGIIMGIIISFLLIKDTFDRCFIAFSLLGEVLLNNIIKRLVKRPRPTINPLVVEKNFSFPSGHTMASTAFNLLILFFVWSFPIIMFWKLIITLIASVIILSVAFSRVYLGVHYTSDVLAGIACSSAYIMLLTLLYVPIKTLF